VCRVVTSRPQFIGDLSEHEADPIAFSFAFSARIRSRIGSDRIGDLRLPARVGAGLGACECVDLIGQRRESRGSRWRDIPRIYWASLRVPHPPMSHGIIEKWISPFPGQEPFADGVPDAKRRGLARSWYFSFA